MIINYSIIEKKPVEFCTLKELKNYLRISHDYDDILIQNLMHTAIETAENFIGISLYNKIVVAKIANALSTFELRYRNILELKNVLLIPDATKESKIEINDKYGSLDKNANIIHLNNEYRNKNLEIEYITGYQDNTFPNSIRHGLMAHIALMYEYSDNHEKLNSQIRDLYSNYRRIKI